MDQRTPSRPARLLKGLLIWLVGGGVITVSIAWYSIVRSDQWETEEWLASPEGHWLDIRKHRQWAVTRFEINIYPSLDGTPLDTSSLARVYRGIRWQFRGDWVPETPEGFASWLREAEVSRYSLDVNYLAPPFGTCTFVESGWPLPTLSCWVYQPFGGSTPTCFGGFALPSSLSRPVIRMTPVTVLPVSPLWPNFAVSAIGYGFPVWLIVTAVGWTRKRARMRRNECIRCRYDLRGLPSGRLCPECGQLTPSTDGRGQCVSAVPSVSSISAGGTEKSHSVVLTSSDETAGARS